MLYHLKTFGKINGEIVCLIIETVKEMLWHKQRERRIEVKSQRLTGKITEAPDGTFNTVIKWFYGSGEIILVPAAITTPIKITKRPASYSYNAVRHLPVQWNSSRCSGIVPLGISQ